MLLQEILWFHRVLAMWQLINGFFCFALWVSELSEITVSIQTLHCFPPDFLKTTEILLSACVILFECKHKTISKQNIIPKLGAIQFNAISIYWTSSISPIQYKQTYKAGQEGKLYSYWRYLPWNLQKNNFSTKSYEFNKLVFEIIK